ncbi:unnamed protein product [Ambrosiozyma monospora]|uniref:Unnamed protein product n=1 Tax=Ambrosiozyma monospora TaxID=43982 RepID=A0A9W6Z5V1_AMBMO|nr:unnamed protein product [Ambrosiozyma monospora]
MSLINSSFLTNRTTLHVANLSKSLKWYSENLLMTQVKVIETPAYKSSFVVYDSQGQPNKGKPLAQRSGVVELRQLLNSNAKVYSGNSDPYRGFGHLCVSVSNIVQSQRELLEKGVDFKKKLEDGRQHNIAFILDPDGYWIELIENEINKKEGELDHSSDRMNHSMIRVKDPVKSLSFYRDVLGMKLFSTRKFPEASFDF